MEYLQQRAEISCEGLGDFVTGYWHHWWDNSSSNLSDPARENVSYNYQLSDYTPLNNIHFAAGSSIHLPS